MQRGVDWARRHGLRRAASLRWLLPSFLLSTTGCSPSLAGTTPEVAYNDERATIEFSVHNASTTQVTAYAQWVRGSERQAPEPSGPVPEPQDPGRGPRDRLGSVRVGTTQSFTLVYQGPYVAISFDVPPGPPPRSIASRGLNDPVLDEATRAGTTRSYWRRVEAGESIVWEIRGGWPVSVASFSDR